MITLSILLTVLITIAIVAAIFILVGGGAFVVAFGDLIVCGMVIWLVVRLFRRRR